MTNSQEKLRVVEAYMGTAALIEARIDLLRDTESPIEGMLELIDAMEQTVTTAEKRFENMPPTHLGLLILHDLERKSREVRTIPTTLGQYVQYLRDIDTAMENLKMLGEIVKKYMH